jgi:putative aldouronate transport system substrate-binding protein
MKRSVLLCLVAVLVISLIVGCSSTNNNKNTASQGKATTDTKTATTGETKATKGEPIVLKFLKPGTPGDSSEISRVEKRIEEKFYEDAGINIDLQLSFYDWDVLAEKFTLDLASGKAADFARFPTNLFFQFYSKGYFQPVGNLVKEHAPNVAKRFGEGEIAAANFKGEMAGFPLGGSPINSILVIRQDKLDALGKKMPTTVAEFEDVMAAYKVAHPKENPFMGVWWAGLKVMNNLVGIENFAGSGKNFIMKPDGTVTSYFMHDKIPAFLELANKWYKNGWVSQDFLTIGDEAEGLFTKDSGLTLVSYGANALESIEQTASSVNPQAKGAVMPVLNADWGNNTATFDGYNSEGYIGIPKSTTPEKAEIIAKFINWELDNPENFWLGKRGELGIDYEIVDGKIDKLAKWKEEGANGYSWEHWMVNSVYINGGDLQLQSLDAVEGNDDILKYIATAGHLDDPMLKTPYLPLGDLAAKVDALNVKLGELQTQIIIGKKPISDWSNAAKIWADGGGLELEQQITEIYKSMTE